MENPRRSNPTAVWAAVTLTAVTMACCLVLAIVHPESGTLLAQLAGIAAPVLAALLLLLRQDEQHSDNVARLDKQDAQLDRVEYQVSDECVVQKANAAAMRVLAASKAAADRVTATAATAVREAVKEAVSESAVKEAVKEAAGEGAKDHQGGAPR